MSRISKGERWYRLLRGGEVDGAWDDFVTRYRRVIFAAIRYYTRDADEVMDVFAHVCEQLRDRDARRLRAFDPGSGTRVTTWLTAVVRNLTVDWFRSRRGRHSVNRTIAGLPAIQQKIFELVAGQGMSYREAYETVAQSSPMSFGVFLREVRGLHTSLSGKANLFQELIGRDPTAELGDPLDDSVDVAILREVEEALESLPRDVRTAVQLFVVEGLTASEVAEVLEWDSAKKVYNTVYRALDQLRDRFHQSGEGA
jgi:RNA polymerase sigma factor (sigma-70 family)